LVSTVNRLQKANLEGKGADEIGGIMEFLVAYTVKHFQDEETLQAQYHYPDFAVHKNYHEDFKRQVGVLTQRMMTEGVSPELVNEVTQHVGDWLLNHIKGDDFKMAAYIQSRDISHERDGNKQPADL
ncbi:MAG: hemerythrin family protein, partial [Clostridiales Family XIII bacterium]|jgi:hemerythrin|nr:hemerythrin family protein [Clostridiales Family XIII bacterium]